MTTPDAPTHAGFGAPDAAALLSWASNAARPLPWRGCRDPWAVLVSEVMLQQTGTARVARHWPTFVRRYRTPASMAAAPVAEVVARWQGLGYNRRAVALHRCATALVERHGGVVPVSIADLEDLPGVGSYTARAVAAFAHGHRVGALDTNVGRILARRTGRRLARGEAQALADDAVPQGRAGEWNQAVFDLGALVCTRRDPACGRCPVRRGCRWGGVGDDPADGSAGVSRPQPPLRGSDREGRARLVRHLASSPGTVPARDVAVVMGWPDDEARAERVLAGLVRDGLVVAEGSGVVLAR